MDRGIQVNLVSALTIRGARLPQQLDCQSLDSYCGSYALDRVRGLGGPSRSAAVTARVSRELAVVGSM